MRGFLLWAPDRPHGHYLLKLVSYPVSSQNLLTFWPWYGARWWAKNRFLDAVLIEAEFVELVYWGAFET